MTKSFAVFVGRSGEKRLDCMVEGADGEAVFVESERRRRKRALVLTNEEIGLFLGFLQNSERATASAAMKRKFGRYVDGLSVLKEDDGTLKLLLDGREVVGSDERERIREIVWKAHHVDTGCAGQQATFEKVRDAAGFGYAMDQEEHGCA